MMQIVATGRDGVATIFKTIYLCVSVNADWQAEALCSHVVRLSVRPLLTCEHEVLKTNFVTWSTAGKSVKRSALGYGGHTRR